MADNNELPQEGADGVEDAPQLTASEQDAMQSGWVPKEDFNGDVGKWVDADEYLRRGELFKKIEFQSRELKDVKRALVEMKKLHSSVREVEYQRAMDTLKSQKKSALEEGDADAVIAADERIALVREQQKSLQAEPVDIQETQDEHPTFVQWKAQNNWYSSNGPMRAFADALGMELAGKGMRPDDVLKQVEKEVRSEFPNRFRNPNQARAGAVEGVTAKGTSRGSFSLTGEETRVMKTLVRQGVMTEAEYIKDIKAIRGN